MDEEGNEMGGLGTIPEARAGIFCFDYESAEAMCFTKVGDQLQISMFNRPNAGDPVGKAGAARLAIGLEGDQGEAFIVLADNAGDPRIRISVNRGGEPKLEFFDANGELIDSLPRLGERELRN
jgi:hypothetical protein